MKLQNIAIKPGVVLNDIQRNKLQALDVEFKGKPQTVTSGVRTDAEQIRIIRKFLVANGLNKTYPQAMVCAIDDKFTADSIDAGQYVWQRAWSHLLNIGVIINPPRSAVVLMDYLSGGGNKKGQTIKPSPHMRGDETACFDLSGLSGLEIAKKLAASQKIRNYVIERKNNCLHIDI